MKPLLRQVVFDFKYLLLGILILMLGGIFVACQKPLDHDNSAEQQMHVAAQAPEEKLKQDCHVLQDKMQSMDEQRSNLSLVQVNQQIRSCLILMDFPAQLKLMTLADQMYEHFLKIDRTPEQQEAFNDYFHAQSQFPTLQQSQYERLHPRDRYLLAHKGLADIDLVETADQVQYQRNPNYLGRVFAPYFPEAERVFMQELAEQNQQASFQQRAFLLGAEEILRRAQFWDHYLQQYPDSHFIQDARFLAQFYANVLFKGLPHDPVSTLYQGPEDIAPHYLRLIEGLANDKKNSPLTKQAARFLEFINLPEQKKNQLVPPNIAKLSLEQRRQAQLVHYLELKPIDPIQPPSRDCFRDAICY